MEILNATVEVAAADALEPRSIRTVMVTYGEQLRDARAWRIAAGSVRPMDLPLPLLYNHQSGNPLTSPVVIGAVVAAADEAGADGEPTALIGTARLADTAAAVEVYQLIRLGALRKASIGFHIHDRETRQGPDGPEVWLTDIEVVELSVVPIPALRSADIRQVASAAANHGGNMDTDQTAAEQAVTLTAGDLDRLVAGAVEKALDHRAAEPPAAELVAPVPLITGRARGGGHRSIGQLAADVNRYARGLAGHVEARDRLGAALESGAVVEERGAAKIHVQAWADSGDAADEAAGVVPPGYLPDLLTILREEKTTAGLFAQRDLPEEGDSVELPKVTTGATVDYQQAEADEVESTTVETDVDSWEKATLAGGQPVSIQAQRWTSPSYMTAVIEDHVAAYGEKLNYETINGVGTATATYPALLGILNAGATDVPAASNDMDGLLGGLGAAAAAVFIGSRRWPSVAIMAPERWGWALGQVGTDGRPLVSDEAPSNVVGFGSARAVGTIRGLAVVVDTAVPQDAGVGNEDPVIVGSFRDAALFEDPQAPATIELTFPDTLKTNVAVYGFSALAIRRPAAFAVVSDLALP